MIVSRSAGLLRKTLQSLQRARITGARGTRVPLAGFDDVGRNADPAFVALSHHVLRGDVSRSCRLFVQPRALVQILRDSDAGAIQVREPIHRFGVAALRHLVEQTPRLCVVALHDARIDFGEGTFDGVRRRRQRARCENASSRCSDGYSVPYFVSM